jgi:hypothetical protein
MMSLNEERNKSPMVFYGTKKESKKTTRKETTEKLRTSFKIAAS